MKTESQKKYENEKTGNIKIQTHKAIIDSIRMFAIDNRISAQKLLLACYNYCIENNISIDDLKKYI